MERVAWKCTEKPDLAVTFLGGCTGIYMMQGVREREQVQTMGRFVAKFTLNKYSNNCCVVSNTAREGKNLIVRSMSSKERFYFL